MKYIYANLKTNFTGVEIQQYLEQFAGVDTYKNKPMIFLNHLYILEMFHRYGGSFLGVQSFDANDFGSYTSSVSYHQLAREGILNVLIGHSEEIKYFGLDLDGVNSQLKIAIENDFQPVVCFGEDDNGSFLQRMNEIEEQLQIILNEIEDISHIVFAYEPKWAIGGGHTIDPKMVLQTVQSLKMFIYDQFGQEACVIYGGSVKPENIHELLDNEIIDGVLIGSAALDVNKYIQMVQDFYA